MHSTTLPLYTICPRLLFYWGEPKGCCVSQPHFEGSVRLPLTLPKMGLGSPPGFPKIQSVIAGVKTPCIEAFFIPLERS